MIDADFKKWLIERFGDDVKLNEPMHRHTSLRVGGPADALVTAGDQTSLQLLARECGRRRVPWMVVAGGTNLLVKDRGIRGVVIDMTNKMTGIEVIKDSEDTVRLMVRAGTRLPALCNYAINNGYAGLSFALGIPATVGGAVKMNAGTAGGAMADVVDGVEIMTADGTIRKIPRAELCFSYRGFAVKAEDPEMVDGVLILKVFMSLRRGAPDALRQAADNILRQRSRRQPTETWSAGCFFRNPPDGRSAGALIDEAGLKGLTKGGAAVSGQHANFIINTGDATAADILELVGMVRETVAERFGVQLEPEVQIVGE
ncbi:MAG: UDP-N-acetylmuramate dehydrogenase [Thermodesulfobacteriota bacterium]|nr:UDP-N-acetylmuramate dehydrogenase [Thermodesulfobacteriota bacterium]